MCSVVSQSQLTLRIVTPAPNLSGTCYHKDVLSTNRYILNEMCCKSWHLKRLVLTAMTTLRLSCETFCR